jgi:hypothetical protein
MTRSQISEEIVGVSVRRNEDNARAGQTAAASDGGATNDLFAAFT